MEHRFDASSFDLSANSLPPLPEHPFYKEGMVHIDAGRWREAFDAFQHLAELYPDVTEAQRLLDDIKMRATLSEVQPQSHTQAAAKRRMRQVITAILGALVIIPVVYICYELWFGPLVRQELRLRQVTSLRQQADQAITAGDYAQAQQLLEKLQTLLPEDPQTAEALARIEQVGHLEQLYDQAQTAIAANEWDQAAAALTQLQALDSQYRDVSQLLKVVQKSQPLETKFQAAEAAFASGQWATAIEQYQALRQGSVTFRTDDIQARLFESYLAYGKTTIDQAETNPAAVSAALAQFSEALKLRPIDPTALAERRLAETYLDALNSNNQAERIELLQSIYNQQPEYAYRAVAQLLYSNLLDRAGQSLAQNNQAAAIADYQLAAQLLVEDTSEAQQHLADLAAESTP